MIRLCKKCPQRNLCVKPCEDLEKLLDRPFDRKQRNGKIKMKRGREIPIFDLRLKPSKERKLTVIMTTPGPDDDLLQEPQEGDEADQDFEPERETVWNKIGQDNLKLGPPLTEEQYRSLRLYINRAIPKRKTTIKNRFLAFMRCDKIVEIARRSNVTKQSVQKQFAWIISRMSKSEIKEEHFEKLRESRLTPKKVKDLFPVEKGYTF